MDCNIALMSETKYVFDLITDKAVSHLNNSDGIYVDDWFHTDGVQYDILNGVKIIGEDGYVNFDGYIESLFRVPSFEMEDFVDE